MPGLCGTAPSSIDHLSNFPASQLPLAYVRTAIHVQHLPGHLTGFCQINDRVHDVFHPGNLTHRLQRLEQILRLPLMHGRIDNPRRNGVDAYALLGIFHRQASRNGLQTSL